MRKRGIIAVGAALAVLYMFSSVAWTQQFRVGFVNLPRVIQESKRADKAKTGLLQLQKRKRTQLDKMKNDLLKLQEDLQKKAPLLNEERRNSMIKQIGIKEMELKLAAKTAERELQDAQAEFQEVFMRDIAKVITKVRKDKGLAMVFNSAALLSAEDAFDITATVIKAYDAAKSAKSKPAPKKRPAAPAKPPKPKNKN